MLVDSDTSVPPDRLLVEVLFCHPGFAKMTDWLPSYHAARSAPNNPSITFCDQLVTALQMQQLVYSEFWSALQPPDQFATLILRIQKIRNAAMRRDGTDTSRPCFTMTEKSLTEIFSKFFTKRKARNSSFRSNCIRDSTFPDLLDTLVAGGTDSADRSLVVLEIQIGAWIQPAQFRPENIKRENPQFEERHSKRPRNRDHSSPPRRRRQDDRGGYNRGANFHSWWIAQEMPRKEQLCYYSIFKEGGCSVTNCRFNHEFAKDKEKAKKHREEAWSTYDKEKGKGDKRG